MADTIVLDICCDGIIYQAFKIFCFFGIWFYFYSIYSIAETILPNFLSTSVTQNIMMHMQIYVSEDTEGHWESRPFYTFTTKLECS